MRGNIVELAIAFVMGLVRSGGQLARQLKPMQMVLARRAAGTDDEPAPPSDEERRHRELLQAVRSIAR